VNHRCKPVFRSRAAGQPELRASVGRPQLHAAPVEACCLKIAGGVEDGCGHRFVGIDEAGGGVCLKAEGFAGQVGQDAVGRDVSGEVFVEGGLLRGDCDSLVWPAASGGGDGAPFAVGLGDREEGGGVETEVAGRWRAGRAAPRIVRPPGRESKSRPSPPPGTGPPGKPAGGTERRGSAYG